jgi:hypothetical protein
MSGERRFSAYLVSAALAASLAACGGGSSSPPTTPTPAPTPTPCTQTPIVQDSGQIPGQTLVYEDFSVPDSGRLDVTLDWTFATSEIGFYLVPANTCTTADEFNAGTCNFLIRSETTTKPRKISTPNFNAGNYRWMVANFSEADESASLLIVLSKGGCPALGGMPSASQRTDDARPALKRALHR